MREVLSMTENSAAPKVICPYAVQFRFVRIKRLTVYADDDSVSDRLQHTFSGSVASDAGATSRDNADTFGADGVALQLVSCTDRIFADGFGVP